MLSQETAEGVPRGTPLPRLRYWRQRRALTQQQLAGAAGVSTRAISRLESDPTRPAEATTHARLARALGVDPAELMAPDGGPAPPSPRSQPAAPPPRAPS
jgi:transcriptional regulator with XRE-family HTH domain